jgi:hypothetical protein
MPGHLTDEENLTAWESRIKAVAVGRWCATN